MFVAQFYKAHMKIYIFQTFLMKYIKHNSAMANLKKMFVSYNLHRKKNVNQAASKTFFYLIQTKYYFLFQMLPSP